MDLRSIPLVSQPSPSYSCSADNEEVHRSRARATLGLIVAQYRNVDCTVITEDIESYDVGILAISKRAWSSTVSATSKRKSDSVTCGRMTR
jgi:hypothetical protein